MSFWKDLCPAGRQALTWFILSTTIFAITYFSEQIWGHNSVIVGLNYWGPAMYFCLINLILRYAYRDFAYQVTVRAAFLGCLLATGLHLASFNNGFHIFGLYTMVLVTFHFSEFMAVAMWNPETLCIDSYILNHSVQYGIAAVASWSEWAIEYYLFPETKMFFYLSYLGLATCVAGEFLRKYAMYTAQKNFTHTVQFVHKSGHKLVTSGVYAWCRHPSYVGWFYWSIGTQIILLNPICLLLYLYASWTFFSERVYYEEVTLVAFFGNQYREYQAKVPTGLPYIEGYNE